MARKLRNRRPKKSLIIPILIGCSFILFFLILYVVGSIVNNQSRELNEDTTKDEPSGPSYKIKYVKDKTKPKRIIVRSPKPETVASETKPTKAETTTQKPEIAEQPITISKISPEQKSKTHLLQIWDALKAYADSHNGRLPVDIFQLSLTQDLLKSPRDNQNYIFVKQQRGENFSDVQKKVIFKEASSTNGSYLCLYGNGAVLENKN
ncbi:MAG: hypothetical protein NE334_00320 [Lentisphaeraceae bacterium]|nr:hypothetical protein [Lentisphaeraceae bacterium]